MENHDNAVEIPLKSMIINKNREKKENIKKQVQKFASVSMTPCVQRHRYRITLKKNIAIASLKRIDHHASLSG